MLPRFRPHLTFADIFGGMTDRSGTLEVLEETFQAKFGFSHAVYFPYARTAIRAFLECLSDRRPEVVFSPYNCTALGQAVVAAGRTPLYVDTGCDFNPDPIQFKAALASSEAACGVATSLWGTDLDPSFFEGVGKPILYDFALRGFSHDQIKLKAGDAVVYSLNWGKPLTAIRGGMLCTHTRAQAIQWREWREQWGRVESNWRSWRQAVALYLASRDSLFGLSVGVSERLGFAKRLLGRDAESGEMDASSFEYPGAWAYALGIRHLNDRERLRSERRNQVLRYHSTLQRLGDRVVLPSGEFLSHYPIRLADRDNLHDYLAERGIFSSHRLYDRLLCDYPAFAGKMWREPSKARALVSDTLHLPLFVGLTEGEQKRVVTQVTRWAVRPALLGKSVPCYVPSR